MSEDRFDRVFRWVCCTVFLACMIPAVAITIWLHASGRCERNHLMMAGKIVFPVCDQR